MARIQHMTLLNLSPEIFLNIGKFVENQQKYQFFLFEKNVFSNFVGPSQFNFCRLDHNRKFKFKHWPVVHQMFSYGEIAIFKNCDPPPIPGHIGVNIKFTFVWRNLLRISRELCESSQHRHIQPSHHLTPSSKKVGVQTGLKVRSQVKRLLDGLV